MQATFDRLEFGPPPPPGFLRALGLAVIAHALLLLALGWGVSWKHQAVTLSAEAELWSAVPQQAAPKLIEVPPPPPEPLIPVIAPKVITPPPAPPVPTVAPKLTDADIALERDKQRLLKEKLLREKNQAERDRQEKLEKLAVEKKRLDNQRLDDKRELDKKLAANKKKADLKQADLKATEQKQAAAVAQEDARNTEVQRQENIKRMAGLAGATGPATSTGTALQASGPSPSYGGRIRARIKPNIVFTEDITTNPTALVEVRTSPDGTIISRKLLKSSGTPAWDAAVLKAIDKTETLPRDTDGRVPPSLEISFRPKD